MNDKGAQRAPCLTISPFQVATLPTLLTSMIYNENIENMLQRLYLNS